MDSFTSREKARRKIAFKTWRVVSTIFSWFKLEGMEGGTPPARQLGERAGVDSRDFATISKEWAAVIYNRLIKGVDAFGKPFTVATHPAAIVATAAGLPVTPAPSTIEANRND